MDQSSRRRPRWIYGQGSEPEYGSSLANERTFLAWVRTALAILAAGVALDVVDLSISSRLQESFAVALVALALFTAVVAWARWAAMERAMRQGAPLPALMFATVFVPVFVAIAGLLIVSWL